MNNWFRRVILFLIAGAGCILSLHYDTNHFKSDRELLLLNRTRPDFQRLALIEKNPSTALTRGDLKEYFDYFNLVTGAMPDNADGFLMLGYLDQITGNQSQAGAMFNRAYHLDGQFFFIEYNLAFNYYKQRDYAQSIEILQKALKRDPNLTVGRMMNSVIYRQIFASLEDKNDIIAGLRQAYQDADALLMEALAKQKGAQGADLGPEVHAHII